MNYANRWTAFLVLIAVLVGQYAGSNDAATLTWIVAAAAGGYALNEVASELLHKDAQRRVDGVRGLTNQSRGGNNQNNNKQNSDGGGGNK